jgi:hypothetical protein
LNRSTLLRDPIHGGVSTSTVRPNTSGNFLNDNDLLLNGLCESTSDFVRSFSLTIERRRFDDRLLPCIPQIG